MAESLTIELPVSIVAEMRTAIESGSYSSTEDVVRDALRLWLERRQDETEQARLRAAWDEGKASGRFGPIDFEDLHRTARQRLAALKRVAG